MITTGHGILHPDKIHNLRFLLNGGEEPSWYPTVGSVQPDHVDHSDDEDAQASSTKTKNTMGKGCESDGVNGEIEEKPSS